MHFGRISLASSDCTNSDVMALSSEPGFIQFSAILRGVGRSCGSTSVTSIQQEGEAASKLKATQTQKECVSKPLLALIELVRLPCWLLHQGLIDHRWRKGKQAPLEYASFERVRLVYIYDKSSAKFSGRIIIPTSLDACCAVSGRTPASRHTVFGSTYTGQRLRALHISPAYCQLTGTPPHSG